MFINFRFLQINVVLSKINVIFSSCFIFLRIVNEIVSNERKGKVRAFKLIIDFQGRNFKSQQYIVF